MNLSFNLEIYKKIIQKKEINIGLDPSIIFKESSKDPKEYMYGTELIADNSQLKNN